MEKEKVKRANKKKIALIAGISVICVIALIFLVLMPVLTVSIYGDNFGERYQTPQWLAFSVSDFEGLKADECTFLSDKGQRLTGYQYSKENLENPKGVVVIAHGYGGGGQNTYMDIADYFTSNGYLAFAYDATGNDKSEGEKVGGLPQGVIDLDYALRYVKQSERYKDLPIVLIGHSWGGYSVGNVLNFHPDVKAAVIISGFNRSADLIEQQGETIVGAGIKLLMPYCNVYERLKFGEYASYSALDGFKNSDAGIMIIHSRDDTTVLPKNGYDKFYKEYGEDPRFKFIEYADRGHNYICNSDASKIYRDNLNKEYAEYVEANGGVYSAEIKTEFMEEHLDKSKCFELDYDLMGNILGFYNDCL